MGKLGNLGPLGPSDKASGHTENIKTECVVGWELRRPSGICRARLGGGGGIETRRQGMHACAASGLEVDRYLDQRQRRRMRPQRMENGAPEELPMRLGQVAALISLGYSDKQIALELGLSPNTIHRHVVRLLKRLGAENRAAAAAIWARRTMDETQNGTTNGAGPARADTSIL